MNPRHCINAPATCKRIHLPAIFSLLIISVVIGVSPTAAQQFQEPPAGNHFGVRQFGAKGDGVALDTDALQRAIDVCSETGGGTVVVGPGTFRIGTLVLKSNVTVYLDAGATLLGSEHLEDYRTHALEPVNSTLDDFGALHLLYAGASKNISISGRGTIDGNGRSFWDERYQARQRPQQMIQFEGCENTHIEGITITNSPFWALHFLKCNRVFVQNITVLNDRRGPNTDGIDISSSSNVSISQCFIDTGDDAICLKGPSVDVPTEHVIITQCTLVSDDSAIKMGTRSHGLMRNIIVSQCIIRDSNYGVALFMKDGGSFEELLVTDLIIGTTDPDLRQRSVYPIFIDVEKRDSKSQIGTIRNITLRGINITSNGHSLIAGMAESPIHGLTLEDIHITIPKPYPFTNVAKPRGVRGLAVSQSDYSRLPSSITIAHARNITLNNVSIDIISTPLKTERHAFAGYDLKGLTIDRLKVRGAERMLALISLDQCADVLIRGVQVPAAAPVFLTLAGQSTETISIIGNDFRFVKRRYHYGEDVRKEVLFESQNAVSSR